MRRTFGPVVLLGLASGTLAAVAGAKPWVRPSAGDGTTAALAEFLATGADRGEVPVVTSLALVALACWGVVLVARGRVRRAVAGLGALASLGALAAVVDAWLRLADRVRTDVSASVGQGVDVGHTAWAYAGTLGVVLLVAATLTAVRVVPAWPEMGARYDSPTGAPEPVAPSVEDASSLDLWRAIDAGEDPTA